MKRILYVMTMCVFALGLLSGCGGEFAEEMEAGKDASKALTGAAVSGQAVSGQSIQTDGDSDSPEEGAEQKDSQGYFDNRFCTERYYYRILYDYDDNDDWLGYIAQISRATGKQRKIRFDEIEDLICVEKDALYYTKWNDADDDYCSLWRLPIESREDGREELKTDEVKMIKGLDDIYYEEDAIYMDEEYIVYSGAIDNDDCDTVVIRYDRASGKKVSLPASEKVQGCIDCDIENIYRDGDCLEIVTCGGIVTWNVKTDDVAVCGDKALDDEEEVVSAEGVCFYETGDWGWDILRIDIKTKEETDFVSEKEILAILEKEAGIPKEQAKELLLNLYYDENCLYMEMCGYCEKEGKMAQHSIILSRKNAAGAPLQYEKEFTEYLWDDNGKRDLGKEEKYAWSKSYLYEIRGGMAYVRWGDEDTDQDDIIYDIKTGKTRAALQSEMLSVE